MDTPASPNPELERQNKKERLFAIAEECAEHLQTVTIADLRAFLTSLSKYMHSSPEDEPSENVESRRYEFFYRKYKKYNEALTGLERSVALEVDDERPVDKIDFLSLIEDEETKSLLSTLRNMTWAWKIGEEKYKEMMGEVEGILDSDSKIINLNELEGPRGKLLHDFIGMPAKFKSFLGIDFPR